MEHLLNRQAHGNGAAGVCGGCAPSIILRKVRLRAKFFLVEVSKSIYVTSLFKDIELSMSLAY